MQGTLAGSSFTLVYAGVIWDESLDTVCASDVPIPAGGCDEAVAKDHVFLYGKFTGTDSEPAWAFPVSLQRFGSNEAAEFATAGTLSLNARDPASNRLSMTFQLEFDSSVTSGEIDLP